MRRARTIWAARCQCHIHRGRRDVFLAGVLAFAVFVVLTLLLCTSLVWDGGFYWPGSAP